MTTPATSKELQYGFILVRRLYKTRPKKECISGAVILAPSSWQISSTLVPVVQMQAESTFCWCEFQCAVLIHEHKFIERFLDLLPITEIAPSPDEYLVPNCFDTNLFLEAGQRTVRTWTTSKTCRVDTGTKDCKLVCLFSQTDQVCPPPT